MTTPIVNTYWDAINSLSEFAQSIGVSASPGQMRQYVEEAYREVGSAHDWSFLHVNGRVLVQAPYETGTVVFDYTGGTYERQLTLTSGTWPDWIENACIRFDGNICDVESRKSDTVVTLDAQMCPLEDVASTTYSAFPRWYILPSDFVSMDQPMSESDWQLGNARTPPELMALLTNDTSTGDIQFYAVGPAPDTYGSMALYVWPPSDATEVLTFAYKRRPRDIQYVGTTNDCPGTIQVSADSKTVTGSSTAFANDMSGSVLRIGASSTYLPTGRFGQYRYAEQKIIQSITGTGTLEADSAVVTSRTGVKYAVTDPIDLDVCAYDAFMSCARKNLAVEKQPKNATLYVSAYQQALKQAKRADYRVTERLVGWTPSVTYTRLADSKSRTVYD